MIGADHAPATICSHNSSLSPGRTAVPRVSGPIPCSERGIVYVPPSSLTIMLLYDAATMIVPYRR